MRIAILPDKFGGTLTASEVAQAIVDGLSDQVRVDRVDVCPMSDGGDGFIAAISAKIPGTARSVEFDSWNGTSITCSIWWSSHDVAYIESEQVLGRSAMRRSGCRLDETRSSRPLASLLGRLLEDPPRSLVIGLGGTLCLDGGLGFLEGHPGSLTFPTTVGADLEVSYREGPLLTGATKGASREEILAYSKRLELALPRLHDLAGRDLSDSPFTGSGGGVAGVLAVKGAHLTSGASLVASILGTMPMIRSASWVITAEGRVDSMSTRGKLLGFIRANLRDQRLTVFCREVVDVADELRVHCVRIQPDYADEYSALVSASAGLVSR